MCGPSRHAACFLWDLWIINFCILVFLWSLVKKRPIILGSTWHNQVIVLCHCTFFFLKTLFWSSFFLSSYGFVGYFNHFMNHFPSFADWWAATHCLIILRWLYNVHLHHITVYLQVLQYFSIFPLLDLCCCCHLSFTYLSHSQKIIIKQSFIFKV